MTDTRVTDLLERLAATAPEPSEDLADAALRSVRHHRRPAGDRRRFVPALVALGTVVAVLLAVGIVAITGRSKQATAPAVPPSPPTAAAAVAAGKRFAQIFFSPDYRSIDDYSRQVVAASTGAFRDDFASKQSDLAELVRKAHSVAHGEVLAAAARNVTANTATVLIVADQNVENSVTKGKPQTVRTRVRVRLQQVDGRWLVAGFEPDIGGPGTGCTDAYASAESNDLLQQSCAAAVRLFSFGYRTLDMDFAAQRAVTTGPFRDEVGRVTNPAVAPLARKEHVSVTATVSDAAIEQQTPTTGTVLAFLNQDTKNDLLTAPRTDRNRVELTMTKVDGRWLVSGLRAL